jgi:tetratricopeptide (TPR) repeat protein
VEEKCCKGRGESDQNLRPEIFYKKGDFIGQKYEVYRVLGKGGFGIVYLVYSHNTKTVLALKTFRDEYLMDAETRKLFRREANVWMDLERHPYIVRAYFVDEVAGRLYIGLEYIAPNEQGLNSLHDYFLARQPPDLAQSLKWAIQFCHGMEHAYLKGVRCHRDIKPSNIMISHGKTVKISDFGLAGVLGASNAMSGVKLCIQQGRIRLSGSVLQGKSCGTPTHMPPEQFTDAASCDQRSDIYAFGVVLYQMAAGDRLPFLAALPKDNSQEEQRRFWKEMYKLHNQALVPKLNSPLFSIIQRCLEKAPDRRYQTFEKIRTVLEPILRHQTGETVKPPEGREFKAWEWVNKGISLGILGRFSEAIECCDEALEINPQSAEAWINKGVSLASLGRFMEAVTCYDKAVKINPQYAEVWYNKGVSLSRLGRFMEAVTCYDKAVKINPQYVNAWFSKGVSLGRLGRFDEAIECNDKALEINPQDADAWINKGVSFERLSRFSEAIECYDKAVKINLKAERAWYNKGVSLARLGRFTEAVTCYDKAVKINPQYAKAWYNKGVSLGRLGRFDESIRCYDRALEINPQDADAWYNKAVHEYKLGRMLDAAKSYRKFIDVAPPQRARRIGVAREQLRKLERS